MFEETLTNKENVNEDANMIPEEEKEVAVKKITVNGGGINLNSKKSTLKRGDKKKLRSLKWAIQ